MRPLMEIAAIRLTAVLFTMLLFAGPAAAGEEPTGFGEFTWGTGKGRLIPICDTSHIYDERFAAAGLSCSGRAIQIGAGRWSPQLVFDDQDGLGGYEILVRHYLYSDLRAIAVSKFGDDAKREIVSYNTRVGGMLRGEQLTWTWPSGTTAFLEERCGKANDSCLFVTTKPYREASAARRKLEAEKSKKQF